MLKMDFNHIYLVCHSEYIDAGAGAASSKGQKLIVSMGHPDAQRGIPENEIQQIRRQVSQSFAKPVRRLCRFRSQGSLTSYRDDASNIHIYLSF